VPKASRKSVLAVEDDEAVRGLIALALERMGHMVITAADASAALDLARTKPFDLLITDIGLPGGSGLALVAQIRTLHPDVAVVVVSGSPPREPIARIAGRDVEILEKPFGLERLRAAVEEALKAADASSES
jgi:DNA-binding NtrC family response regulator